MGEAGMRLAVVGNPVLHSRSPVAFCAAFAACGIDAAYTRIAASSAQEALEIARRLGLRGMNVTTPFKAEMAALVDRVEGAAAALGAVNTIAWERGEIVGANTDPDGVAALLDEAGVKIAGESVAVLGKGAAARSAEVALLGARARDVRLLGREAGPSALRELRVVVSCVPPRASHPALEGLRQDHVLLDAAYVPSAAKRFAAQRGCRYHDGSAWLAAQAKSAFCRFTGQDVPPGVIGEAMENVGRGSRKRKIALVGMMGSGKTTVGRLVAERLGIAFEDTDAVIEAQEGQSIARIFEARAQEGFRRIEADVVERCCREGPPVLALGGGSLTAERVRNAARAHRTVIWLAATAEACARRAANNTRPLLGKEARESDVARLLEARQGTYFAASDLVVDTSERSATQVARRIVDEMRSAGLC